MKKLLISLLILSGCSVHQAPFIAYQDRDAPLSNTAVLVAFDNNSPALTGADVVGVKEVDGASMDCFNSCPFWVRVKPGRHTFNLRYQADSRLSGLSVAGPEPGFKISFKLAMIPLTVQNMQAGHTYLVRYQPQDGRVIASVEDLGQNANFGMPICGMYGDCKMLYRAKFE